MSSKDNVVSIFSAKKEAKTENSDEKKDPGDDFEAIMKANEINKERVERERKNANKSVLRSYRIKY